MIYKYPDIPVQEIKEMPIAKKPKGNPGRKKKPSYLGVVCAFDIETTSIKKIRQSVMYIWQYQIGPEITIIGRTWIDFLALLGDLSRIHPNIKYVTFVHNLSFEFQFLSGIWNFAPEDVFCTEPRAILRADMGPLELRCSYRLTNMSLSEFTNQMKVAHRKLSGEKFDYNKQRFPWTRLTDYELAYCCNDVIGLVEAIITQMVNDGDDLYSLPMTSTGYVRRDIKKAMKTFNWTSLNRLIPPYSLHKHLKEAFRGGNTHANRHIVGQMIHNVRSMDMASAYPSAQVNKEFPMGRWYEPDPKNLTKEFLNDLINRRHKAVIVEVAFKDIHLRDPRWPVPYLASDKCRHILPDYDEAGRNVTYDNGRILSARYLETTLTNIDLKIVLDEYDADKMDIKYIAFSTYGKLPAQYRECVLDYYHKKTTLRGVESQEWIYAKSKAKLNAIYGCSVMDPLQISYHYEDDAELEAPYLVQLQITPHIYELIRDKLPASVAEDMKDKIPCNLVRYRERIPEALFLKIADIVNELNYEHYTKYAYSSYAWGVWTTAYCRQRLEEAIRHIFDEGQRQKGRGENIRTVFCYCDTDSVKYFGPCDFTELNERYKQESIRSNGYATDPKGKVHYLGVFEDEGVYDDFLTWGAKKYIYRQDAKIKPQHKQREYNGKIIDYVVGPDLMTVAGAGDTWHITIAGVNKKDGARELEKAGGAAALLPGPDGYPHFVFKESGGTEAVYNDRPEQTVYKIHGREVQITRNLYLEKHPYTLSITPSFFDIISYPDLWRDLLDARAEV